MGYSVDGNVDLYFHDDNLVQAALLISDYPDLAKIAVGENGQIEALMSDYNFEEGTLEDKSDGYHAYSYYYGAKWYREEMILLLTFFAASGFQIEANFRGEDDASWIFTSALNSGNLEEDYYVEVTSTELKQITTNSDAYTKTVTALKERASSESMTVEEVLSLLTSKVSTS